MYTLFFVVYGVIHTQSAGMVWFLFIFIRRRTIVSSSVYSCVRVVNLRCFVALIPKKINSTGFSVGTQIQSYYINRSRQMRVTG